MSWSYSGDPTSSTKDWIRWRLGLTNSADKLQSDAEIAAALSEYGDKRLAAAKVAETIAGTYARRVDTTMGKMRIAHSQRVAQWQGLATSLRAEVAVSVAPWAGGVSVADKEAQQADTDRVKPAFAVGMVDVEHGQHAESQLSSTE